MNDISVIIPVYNVQDYLEECLQSVVAQTLRPHELLLVNDGSTDRSRAICASYAEKHSWIRLIDQENQGQSAARNAALDRATGDYIAFIDSDDYVSENMLAILREKMAGTGADMVKCGTYKFDENSISEWRGIEGKEVVLREKKDFLQAFFEKKIINNVWNALYRKELFEDLRFISGKIMEDNFITPQLLVRCNKIVIIPDHLYYYRQRPGATMYSFDSRHFDVIESDYRLRQTLENEGLYETFREEFNTWFGFHLMVLVKNAARYSSFFRFRGYARRFHDDVAEGDLKKILNNPDTHPDAIKSKKVLRDFANSPFLFWIKQKKDQFKKSRRFSAG